jgi:NAD(P)-dependent dehydrogenase (short-subunit alcohol dehydrogenase family)
VATRPKLTGCGNVIDELADGLNGVDVFVNNAGTGSSTLALDTPIEEWRHVVATDLDGAFACIQRAVRQVPFREMRGANRFQRMRPSQQPWLPGWG